MKILFVDPTCARPYHHDSLHHDPIAGTEISVIRIAEMLSKTHAVFVAQHCRHQNELNSSGANYITFEMAKKMTVEQSPDVLIYLRKYQHLDQWASLYPRAKKIFWHHDLARYKMRKWRTIFIKHHCPIIGVSDFHLEDIKEKLKGKWHHQLYDFIFRKKQPLVIRIYNPLQDDLNKDHTPVDINKTVFFSSPNKGLDETIRLFLKTKTKFPDLKLYVTNPGYIDIDGCKQLSKELLAEKGIIILGVLNKQADVIRHVRESFCVFYPQKYKAENFGFIYAEANAVGTPVLAHDFGAAREVLSNDDQLIDANREDVEQQIIEKIKKWREHGRPEVHAKNSYRASTVIKDWERLLAESPIHSIDG